MHLGEQVGEAFGAGAVERAGGLVGEEELRAVDERAGDGGALAFAAGELAGAVVEPVAEADCSEELRGAGTERGAVGVLADDGGDEDVLQHGALREQVVELEDEADGGVAEFGELLCV